MVREELEIRTNDGSADAVLYRPEGAGPWPGVLHLTDIYGIRPAYHQMAGRLAAEGYLVLMPNIFYRTARPPVMERKPGDEQHFRKRLAELTAPLTPEAIAADAQAYVSTLAAQNQIASESRLGVVGYCYSGGFALRVAAACPSQIAAAASFHGGNLATDSPASPHLLLPHIRAKLYFAHATNDRSMPAAAIQTLEAALAAWKGSYESETYPAAHGWTASDNPAFNQPQADRAFTKLTALFAATLR